MSIKRWIPCFAALLALTACEKDADLDKLSSQNLVYVDYNSSFNKADYQTFWVRDTIRVVLGKDSVAYMRTVAPVLYDTLVNAFKRNLVAQGLTEAADSVSADLGVQITYTSETYRITDYYSGYDPWYSPWYYWYGGWGYWGPYYNGWGGWGPNGSSISYAYSTGSVMANLIALGNSSLTVEWYTCIHSLVGSSGYPNPVSASRGIDYAFAMPPFSK